MISVLNNFRSNINYTTNFIKNRPAPVSCNSVSFTGNKAAKLSTNCLEQIQNFTKNLTPNKLYKFENPNIEKLQITSVLSGQKPEARTLYINYASYSKNNIAKYITCSIDDAGNITQNGKPLKKAEEVTPFETILSKLINFASKKFIV